MAYIHVLQGDKGHSGVGMREKDSKKSTVIEALKCYYCGVNK